VPYAVTIAGVADEALASFLRTVSVTASEADEPAPSLLALRRRTLADEDRLTRALAGEGYYDARVVGDVAPRPDEPAAVRFEVRLGPRYTLADVDLSLRGERGGYRVPALDQLGLTLGEPAVAQRIIDAEAAFLEDARAAGHAYAELGERRAVIDREAKTLAATFVLRPGPVITLGEVTYDGVDGVREGFVRDRLPFAPGEARYRPDLVRETRRELVATGLFSTVQVNLPETPPADGVAPVSIAAVQRLHRTISGGVRFETDGGPGVNLGWEHRNMFGGAERLQVALDADLLRQSLSAGLRTPDFFGRSRSFLAESELVREITDAFDSLAIRASAGVEQRFSDRLRGTLGLGWELSEVTDESGTESFSLVFIPATLRYDDTDSVLDPSEGVRLRFDYTPFWDVFNPGLFFQRTELGGSTYLTLTESPRLILAVRGRLGSITGADRASIPANRRFYAGGGGSVRGIPFQLASPLDAADDPIGGRSVLEGSAELRYNVTETIGVVGFVDGGRAFEASYPDFDDPLIFGAGLGLRYFTPVGPLRVDVAVPLDRRDVDDAFQFYVSLGQAF
jgi:translocation and assembly module TamA